MAAAGGKAQTTTPGSSDEEVAGRRTRGSGDRRVTYRFNSRQVCKKRQMVLPVGFHCYHCLRSKGRTGCPWEAAGSQGVSCFCLVTSSPTRPHTCPACSSNSSAGRGSRSRSMSGVHSTITCYIHHIFLDLPFQGLSLSS